ncbi:MAG: hypothetical protein K5848_00690 [Lachnospiraceae bacterium]|nr:hypothetical protein [Lachnospiraceae bacterium]
MACFIVPAAEAVITTVATKVVESGEKKADSVKEEKHEAVQKVPFSRKLKWLNNMLWGGSALLAFEHVWHGEVVPYFPFLTAAGNPNDLVEMLQEMSTTGVTMAALTTLVWAGMVAAASAIEKRNVTEKNAQKQEE